MTTLNIILAACLTILSSVAVILIIRAMRQQNENELFSSALAEKEKELQKRSNTLDLWKSQLEDQTRRVDKWIETHKRVYANFEVLDSDENKPDMKTVGKSLSSKIGYALRKQFPAIQQHHDEKKGGRTVYSVDFYAAQPNE